MAAVTKYHKSGGLKTKEIDLVVVIEQTGLFLLAHLTLLPPLPWCDKLSVAEIEKFYKSELKKTEMQEKNLLLSKEMIEQVK